jgi:hypothetical protein
MTEPFDVEPEPTPARRPLLPTILALAAVLAIVVGVILVVVKDGDETATDAVGLLSAAPDAARDAGTARLTMTVSMSGAGADDFGFDGHGVVDFVTGASSFEMSMLGMSFEMRIVDGSMFMRLPSVARGSIEEEWIGFPADQPSSEGSIASFAPNGAGMIDALRGVGDVEELGAEEVNGVQATGYRVTIDVDRALEAASEGDREELRAAVGQLGSEWPMEVWVTDSGLPVRMEMSLSPTDLFDMTMRFDFTDFGVDADIQAPPADDVRFFEDPSEIDEILGDAPGPELQPA